MRTVLETTIADGFAVKTEVYDGDGWTEARSMVYRTLSLIGDQEFFERSYCLTFEDAERNHAKYVSEMKAFLEKSRNVMSKASA